jgi:TonB family protein
MGGSGRGRKEEKESDRVLPGVPLNFAHGPGHPGDLHAAANEAFKHGSQRRVALGLIAAVTVHVAIFELFPRMSVDNLGAAVTALETIELPPEVRIPPPPEHISRPATPKVASIDMEEDVTIAPTTFESNPVENLPPPPQTGSPADRPSFIPYTVAPSLQNKKEVLSYLQRVYPNQLRMAGVGGAVVLWLYIDEDGQVLRTVVAESSGYHQLDDAAQQVAAKMEWSPALNRDKKTAVWLSQAIDFSVT